MVVYTRSTYSENQKLAEKCRRVWGIGDTLRPDLIRVLEEEFPKDFPGFKLVELADKDFSEGSASANRTKNIITLRRSVREGAKRLRTSDLYAVAEEIGHFLHEHEGIRFRRTGALRNAGDFNTGVYEREAKQFASLLLAPTRLIASCSTVDEILDMVPLTRPAAKARLDEIRSEERVHQSSLYTPKRITPKPKASTSARNVTLFYDEAIDAPAPTPTALAIVDVEQGRRDACKIYGHIPGNRLKFVEISGPEKYRLLEYTGPQLFVKRLRGSAVVRLVGWQDEPTSTAMNPESEFCRLNGYDGSVCPSCDNKTVRADGNCKTCRCGWTSSTT